MPLPRRLHLELTNRCNSRCRTCVRTARPELEHDLRLDEVQRIVAGLPDLQSAALQVNGEPLLSSRLAEVVRLLVRRGVSVELNTNGTGLDGPRATSLIDARLDRLHVSMDAATPATYRRLRGIDALDTVVANLERFVRLRERSTPALPRLALWMTATRHNLHELPELVELAARIGAEEVYLQRLVYFGAGLAREPDSLQGRLSARQRATIAQAEERASGLGVDLRACGGHTPVEMLCPPEDPEPWRSCRRPRQSAVVMADGDVVPCCIGTFVGNRDAIRMGNLRKTGWHEIWNGARYAQLRADLLAGPGPAFCRPCGVRWSL